MICINSLKYVWTISVECRTSTLTEIVSGSIVCTLSTIGFENMRYFLICLKGGCPAYFSSLAMDGIGPILNGRFRGSHKVYIKFGIWDMAGPLVAFEFVPTKVTIP